MNSFPKSINSSMPIPLEAGYSAEFNKVDKKEWHDIIRLFDDANFYQTWSYGAIRWGEHNVNHVVLKKNNAPVSIAQIRILRAPVMRIGVAYIFYGPMWKVGQERGRSQDLRNMLRALRAEYSIRRGYLIRILPNEVEDNVMDLRKIYEDEGFIWSPISQHTAIVDLSIGIDEIRKNLKRGWRRSLVAAEKEELEYIEGSDNELFEMGMEIIREMKLRKKFVEFKDMEEIKAIHKDLPDNLKLKIVLCKYKNEPVAILGWFPIGKMGHPLLGATGDKGLPLKASFPLWWKMIEYYKNQGFKAVNLVGINRKGNPGGYFFKMGLGGKNCVETCYLGLFESCTNIFSLIFFRAANFLREIYRKSLVKLNNIFRKRNSQQSKPE